MSYSEFKAQEDLFDLLERFYFNESFTRRVLQYLDEYQDGDVHTEAYRRHLNSHIEEGYGEHKVDLVIHSGYIKNTYYLILS